MQITYILCPISQHLQNEVFKFGAYVKGYMNQSKKCSMKKVTLEQIVPKITKAF